MNKIRSVSRCLAAVILMVSWGSRRSEAIVYPDVPRPDGRPWMLSGVELVPNGTFESDTVGNIPAGWLTYYGLGITTAADGASGSSQSMEWTSSGNIGGGRMTLNLPTTTDRYYQLSFNWKKVSNDSGNVTIFGTALKDLASPTQTFNTDGFTNIGAQASAGTFWTGFSANSRWPGYMPYNATIGTWNTFSTTFQTLPDIATDFTGILNVGFWASQGNGTLRVDNVSLQEFIGLPEPGTGLLLPLGGLVCWRWWRRGRKG